MAWRTVDASSGQSDGIPATRSASLYHEGAKDETEGTAALFHVRQSDISKMLRGEFRLFSVERSMPFLVKLDQDVEIVVRSHRVKGDAPAPHLSSIDVMRLWGR